MTEKILLDDVEIGEYVEPPMWMIGLPVALMIAFLVWYHGRYG